MLIVINHYNVIDRRYQISILIVFSMSKKQHDTHKAHKIFVKIALHSFTQYRMRYTSQMVYSSLTRSSIFIVIVGLTNDLYILLAQLLKTRVI